MIEQQKRGVKRKRETGPENQDVTTKARQKLFHGIREVKRAAKKVKTFELQKLVKKLKSLRDKNDSAQIESTEAQLNILKGLDHESIALKALASKLKKDKLLAKHESIQGAIPQELKSPTSDDIAGASSSHRALVESRLLSSKVLAQEISEVALSLRKLIDPTLGDASTPMSKTADSAIGEGSTSAKRTALRTQGTSEIDAEDVGLDDSDEESEEDIDDDALEASGSGVSEADDADGWESGSVDDDLQNPEPENDEASSDDDAGSANEDNSPGPKPARLKLKQSSKVSANVKSNPAGAAESRFLPSLSVGFTRGDSDSDWSDGEAGLADGPIKKNRRGQRARKAIWEKKYGRNANHLRKQRDEMSRDMNSRGVKPAAVSRGHQMPRSSRLRASTNQDSQYPGLMNQQHRTGGKPMNPSRAEGYPRTGPVGGFTVDDKPLHPSWEAKKKLKQAQNDAIVPSQGKRLKFD